MRLKHLRESGVSQRYACIRGKAHQGSPDSIDRAAMFAMKRETLTSDHLFIWRLTS
jgi:hypothetical protein